MKCVFYKLGGLLLWVLGVFWLLTGLDGASGWLTATFRIGDDGWMDKYGLRHAGDHAWRMENQLVKLIVESSY